MIGKESCGDDGGSFFNIVSQIRLHLGNMLSGNKFCGEAWWERDSSRIPYCLARFHNSGDCLGIVAGAFVLPDYCFRICKWLSLGAWVVW